LSTCSSPHPWVIVAVGFAALALSFTFRMIVGVAMPTWEQALGWSRELISGNGAIGLVVMAALFPLVGAIVDRIGARSVLVVGCTVLGVGMALIGLMSAPWHLAVAYGLLGGFGFTLVGNTVVSVMVARAFEARRGLATGIATSGATGGQLVLIPLIVVAFGAIGWRASFGVLAASFLALALIAFVLLRGERGAKRASDLGERASFAQSLGVFVRDPGFHALAAAFFVCGATTTGLIETHFIPFAIACGFPPLPSALAYSVLAATNLAGMMLFGWLCDRYNRSVLLAVIYGVRGLVFFVPLVVGTDYATLLLFAVIAGLVEYATLPATAGLSAARYGVANLGKAMGVLMTAHSLGAALGVYAGGRVFVSYGSYDIAWIGGALAALTAALVVLLATDPRHRAPGRRLAAPAGA
jgi:MFS family permease